MNIFLVLLLLLLLPVCHFAAVLSSLGLFENKQLEGMYVAHGNCSVEGGGRAGGRQIKLMLQNLSHGRKNILSVKFQTIASETLLVLVFPKCDGKTVDGRWAHEYVVYMLHERIACSSAAP